MADLLRSGVAWLDNARRNFLASDVTYRRGDDELSIVATLGATDYEVTDDAGAVVETSRTDFLISAADLVFGGVVSAPELGDQIDIVSGGQTVVFEVRDLAGGGHYRKSDPLGVLLRIHTKEIDAE